MGQLGNLGQMFSTLGGDVLSGAQALGSDVMTGINDVGSSLSGLFGGGGAVSPGTLGATAAQTANAAAPSMSAIGADIGQAAPTAAQSASAFEAAPGLTADALQGTVSPGMTPGLSSAISGAIPGGAMNQDFMSTVLGAGSGIDGVGGGVNPNPTLGGGNFLQSLLKNPELMKAIIPGIGLIKGATEQPPGLKNIQALEQQQAGMAKNQGELAQAEEQGLLPQGAMNMFQGQLQAAEAAIRAKYAQMGMTGSTAEMQDLQAAREGIMGQMFAEGQNMAKESWTNYGNATKYQSDLLTQIMNEQIAQEKDFQTALGNMAAAFTDPNQKA